MSELFVYAEEIKKLVPMKEAMELYGFSVSSKGLTVCPFHSEKTGSFKVYPDHFYCFGCGVSGDVVAFVQKYFGLGFKDAIKKINDDFDLRLPLDEKESLRELRRYKEQTLRLKRARQRERDEEELRQREFDRLAFEEKRMRSNMKRYRPEDPTETPDPLFVEACLRLEYISCILDTFEFTKGGSAT